MELYLLGVALSVVVVSMLNFIARRKIFKYRWCLFSWIYILGLCVGLLSLR